MRDDLDRDSLPKPPDVPLARVAVLLCTFDGERFLRQQLDTIIRQTHNDWVLFVSDDGSRDGTTSILLDYADRLGPSRMRLFKGPARGFSANFLSLMAREDVQANYFAFTDQDDEWDPTKLERAVAMLSRSPGPAIYGSRSELIDQDGGHIGFSRAFGKPGGFANALVQNMATGNTMVINQPAMALMRQAGLEIHVSAHDWWAYLLVTGGGGTMHFDLFPTIRYRQHDRNLYGGNTSWRAKWRRIAKLIQGDFRDWNGLNIGALRRNWHLLTVDSRRRLVFFERAREASAMGRLILALRAGVYRQTWDGQLGLLVAVLLRKI